MVHKLQDEIKKSMRNKNKGRLIVLRSLMSEAKNKAIDAGRREPTADDVLECVTKGIKQRNDSIAEYKKAGRDDLVQKEESEVAVLQEFQPAQLTEEEIIGMIEDTKKELGVTAMADMGKLMGALMPRVKGRAEGGLVSKLVRSSLT
ncbi:MAG: GatB/YqeY domain-containing protein [Fibrobacterota bacterium]